MHHLLSTLTAITLLLLTSSPTAASARLTTTEFDTGISRPTDPIPARFVRIAVIPSGSVVSNCDTATLIERAVTTCAASGCSSVPLPDTGAVSIGLTQDSVASIEVSLTALYTQGGVVQVDTLVDSLSAQQAGTRISQTVEGKAGCLVRVSYEVTETSR